MIAGNASSTTMTRLSVEVVSTTMDPSEACTSPSRTMPSQPNVRITGCVFIGRPAARRR